ncbi:MAG: Ankyrin repeats (3 copies) [Betaproteobacteria bacterium ADurb.Bin341]|nr:MAG: Ankyrin repeats (3 copies) [Betaproteobacteria bacterium ADurb.Bin341]
MAKLFRPLIAAALLAVSTSSAIAQNNKDDLIQQFFADRRPEIEKIADHPEQLKSLVLSQKQNPNVPFENGKTLLHYAANRGYVEIVQLLLEHGAKLDVQDKNKKTPLHEAMAYHHDKVARLLIEKGANVNLRDKEGKTPLFSIVFMDGKERNLALARLFIQKGYKLKTPDADLLNQTIRRGHQETALLLLQNGIPFSDGTLASAAAMGFEDIFNFLLQKGAQPKQPDILSLACQSGNLNIVKTLTEKGNAPTLKDIDQALALGHTEVAQYLNAHLNKTQGKQVDLKERCRIKPEPGDCKALFTYAYYDQNAKRCFEATGCGGVMPFDSLEACKKVCE